MEAGSHDSIIVFVFVFHAVVWIYVTGCWVAGLLLLVAVVVALPHGCSLVSPSRPGVSMLWYLEVRSCCGVVRCGVAGTVHLVCTDNQLSGNPELGKTSHVKVTPRVKKRVP